MSAAVVARGLHKRFGEIVAVDGVDFEVERGERFGFLGPNGAGKTTTIKALLGFRKPDAGSGHVLGFDVMRESLEVRARIGYVSETNSMYDYLTIPQLCAFCRSTSRRWDQATVDRHIKSFGLPPTAKVRQLSKGQKSQLALSVALGSDPQLLILDEPTTGLDPLARHQFLNIIVGDFAASGKTIFFSSHILSEVEAVADWVCIINKGRLVVTDELDSLKAAQRVLLVSYKERPTAAQVDAIRGLPGVAGVEQEGRNARVLVRGDAELLAGTIAADPAVLNVDTSHLNLEDLFLEYMKDDRR